MKMITSTNGQNNVVLFVLAAFVAFFGGDPETITLAALVMLTREVVKGDRPGRWTGNVLTYIAAAAAAAIPTAAGIFEQLPPLIDAIINSQPGGFDLAAIIPLLLPVLNEVLFLIQNRNKEPEEKEPATLLDGNDQPSKADPSPPRRR